MLIWCVYVSFQIVPDLDVTLWWIMELAVSDVIVISNKEVEEQEEMFKDMRFDLNNGSICGMVMFLLLLLRSVVLILIVSGKYNYLIDYSINSFT